MYANEEYYLRMYSLRNDILSMLCLLLLLHYNVRTAYEITSPLIKLELTRISTWYIITFIKQVIKYVILYDLRNSYFLFTIFSSMNLLPVLL